MSVSIPNFLIFKLKIELEKNYDRIPNFILD
jgi:hypothetical protein